MLDTRAVASVTLTRIDGPGHSPVMGCMTFGGIELETLEPAAVDPYHQGHPCIPVGTYPLVLAPSPKFGPETIHVIDVPGRDNILIHNGNTEKDSLGCILVGMRRAGFVVSDSVKALGILKSWMREMEASNTSVQLVVV